MDAEGANKAIGRRDIILFCVSAILLLDTVASGAAIGPSSLFWWLFLALIFFVPHALIAAELGCSFPDQGGIYAWVRRAHGARWGARITWAYWVNVAVWVPSIATLFAGVFDQVFGTNLSLVGQIGLGLAVIWAMVFINCIALDVGKWVPNLGAIFKIIVFLAVIIGGFVYFQNHGSANVVSLETMRPTLSDGIQYLPVIIYGMLGFELVSAGANDIEKPAKNVPFGILVSGFIIITFYVLATLAVLVAVPVAEINLVEGLVNTLSLFFGGNPIGDALIYVLAIGALYTFFSNGVTWALGTNRAAAQAAKDGELPAIFGYESPRRKTPVGAAMILGASSSIILILYGFLVGSDEDLFWSLFAFSGVIFSIPYVAMMTAYIALKSDNTVKRPFKVPGSNAFAISLAASCALILCFTILLFNYVPGEGVQWEVLIGSVVLLSIGEVIVRTVERS